MKKCLSIVLTIVLCTLTPAVSVAQSNSGEFLLSLKINVGGRKNAPDAVCGFIIMNADICLVGEKQYLQLDGEFTYQRFNYEETLAAMTVLDAFNVGVNGLAVNNATPNYYELSYPLGGLTDSNVLMAIDGIDRQAANVTLSYAIPAPEEMPYIELSIRSLLNAEAEKVVWKGKIDEDSYSELECYDVWYLNEERVEIWRKTIICLFKDGDQSEIHPPDIEGYETPAAVTLSCGDWAKRPESIQILAGAEQFSFVKDHFEFQYTKTVEDTPTVEPALTLEPSTAPTASPPGWQPEFVPSPGADTAADDTRDDSNENGIADREEKIFGESYGDLKIKREDKQICVKITYEGSAWKALMENYDGMTIPDYRQAWAKDMIGLYDYEDVDVNHTSNSIRFILNDENFALDFEAIRTELNKNYQMVVKKGAT